MLDSLSLPETIASNKLQGVKMKRIVLCLIVLLAINALFAFNDYSTAMGLHFGTSTGNGYSIRKWNDNNGYQLVFSAYAFGSKKAPTYFDDKNYKNGRRQAGEMSFNYLWDLRRTSDYHFYIMSGASYKLQKVKRFYRTGDTEWVRDDKWAVGAGPGFEWKLAERFHMSLELPITYNQSDDIVPYIPALGIYYYFK